MHVVFVAGERHILLQVALDAMACNYATATATIDDGSCLTADCNGDCGGTAEVDACGVCGGDGTSCAGCTDAMA